MMKQSRILITLMSTLGAGIVACSASNDNEPYDAEEEFGEAEVALTNAPADASCLRITAIGERTDTRTFSLTPGENAVFRLRGLPLGDVTFLADAFDISCSALIEGVSPSWYSEPVVTRLRAGVVKHVSLRMIHNGQASVGIDFDDDHAPSEVDYENPLEGGTFSSAQPYVVPVAPGVLTKAILTVGDSPNDKPDMTPYRMVGIPDGLGAFDNGDGTFTLLANHELGNTNGIVRAHGAAGAFVSRWIVRKADLAVMHGEDLIQQIVLWNPATHAYNAATTGVAFGRFCGAELPNEEALYDFDSDLGYDGRAFFDGEENGDNGRAMVHLMNGTSYEFARMGKMSFENVLPNPHPGVQTIVAGTDDSGGGQVYFYYGTKTATGTPVAKAGLTNGSLYGLRVEGVVGENSASGIPTGPFELYEFGNVEDWTGTMLQTASADNDVTEFNRPEDGAWDPNNTHHFYFVTTASLSGSSRLWRLSFTDVTHPELGGEIEMLLSGSEGGKMFDNMVLDQYGHAYLQEDVGNNAHIGKVWRYDIATDTLVEVARHNPAFFDPTAGSPTFITADEESSGIVDAADILGAGWFLLDVQSHNNISGELVQGGQFLAMYDPAAAGL